jgi:hypothetical protein
MDKTSPQEERRNAFNIMSAYRITEVGFEYTEAIFFRTTIEMASGYDIADWRWVGDRDADVILVNSDIDECTSKFNLDKPAQNTIRPILIGCSTSGGKSASFSYTLKKPITFSMIISLVLKLEQDLARVAQTPPLPAATEQHADSNEQQHSNTSLEKETDHEDGVNPEPQRVSTSQSSGENLDQNDLPVGFVDDSDYDVYDLLMDSDFENIQPEVKPPPNTSSQQQPAAPQNQPDDSLEIKTYNIKDLPTRRFPEDRRFLGIIRKYALVKHPTEISHYIYPPVRIYPDQQIFAHKSDQEPSADIFVTHSSGFSIQELLKPEDQVPPKNWITRPLWLLFYLATLYGSEGKLKDNNSPHDKLSLTSKPDFDIVPNRLDYMIIADYMLNKEPQDLDTISDGSGISLKTVIDFCNACEEIDIIDRISSHSQIKLSSNISHDQNSGSSKSNKYPVADEGLLKRFISKFKHTGQS